MPTTDAAMPAMRVGVIGLGVMGRPMAANLMRAGFPVAVYARRVASADSLVAEGAVYCESPASLAERSDAIIVTGGLGPTSDDPTREITAEVLGLELITDEAALRSLTPVREHVLLVNIDGLMFANYASTATLARTLLAPASVVILDEPAAGLDADTERAFLQTLDEAMGGRSVILIQHHLLGVERPTRILRLAGGRAIPAAG
jgi:hypothetical protein